MIGNLLLGIGESSYWLWLLWCMLLLLWLYYLWWWWSYCVNIIVIIINFIINFISIYYRYVMLYWWSSLCWWLSLCYLTCPWYFILLLFNIPLTYIIIICILYNWTINNIIISLYYYITIILFINILYKLWFLYFCLSHHKFIY